jgi:hypothetical protein
VFIPGGCAHQVRNLKSCCKVRMGRHGWAGQTVTGAGMGWVRLPSVPELGGQEQAGMSTGG